MARLCVKNTFFSMEDTSLQRQRTRRSRSHECTRLPCEQFTGSDSEDVLTGNIPSVQELKQLQRRLENACQDKTAAAIESHLFSKCSDVRTLRSTNSSTASLVSMDPKATDRSAGPKVEGVLDSLSNSMGKHYSQQSNLIRLENSLVGTAYPNAAESLAKFRKRQLFLAKRTEPKRKKLFKKCDSHRGRDCRPTTLMIRNIPERYTRNDLIADLAYLGFAGLFDFLYIPVGKHNEGNGGYAFVNFVHDADAHKCAQALQGFKFKKHGKDKSQRVADISVAHIQGLEANLAHYEGSAVNHCKPKHVPPLILVNISSSLSASTK